MKLRRPPVPVQGLCWPASWSPSALPRCSHGKQVCCRVSRHSCSRLNPRLHRQFRPRPMLLPFHRASPHLLQINNPVRLPINNPSLIKGSRISSGYTDQGNPDQANTGQTNTGKPSPLSPTAGDANTGIAPEPSAPLTKLAGKARVQDICSDYQSAWRQGGARR